MAAGAEHAPSPSGGRQQRKACVISFCVRTEKQKDDSTWPLFFYLNRNGADGIQGIYTIILLLVGYY